ncbi:MAG TPA: cytochrome c oxidase subunit 3, partial [Planctomycetaceae bacterium]|nr:cytochrome c oxidase subunit 3 [Planctomycetaceae bacterium]
MTTAAPPARTAIQFDTPEQQYEAATVGMWLFLASEVLFFGGALTAYSVYRWLHAEAFVEGSRHLDLILGTINTAVLLGSSLMMALAVHAAQTGRQTLIAWFLIATIVLGGAFLAIKSAEYSHKVHEGLVPTTAFELRRPHDASVAPERVQLFFCFYWGLTSLHAAHMLAGMGVMAALVV